MRAEMTGNESRVFGKKTLKRVAVGLVGIILLGAIFFLAFNKITGGAKTAVKQQTAVVTKGDMSITLTGSGSITSSNREEMTPLLNGTIQKVFFKEGDKVKTGDILFEMDDSEAKLNVEKVKNNIMQTELTMNSSSSDLTKLNVTAPFSGQISGISVKTGDVVNKNAPVLTITDQSKLKLLIPFSDIKNSDIKTGQSATVYLQDLMQSVAGSVTYVSQDPYTTLTGGELYNVEISINNPGSLKEGMKANAEIITTKGTFSSTDNGTLTYNDNLVVKSETGGTVKSIHVKENQNVRAGAVLIEFTNDDMVVNSQTNEIKLHDLQAQLASAQKQLENCVIKSPIDGVITQQETNAGDVVKSGDVISTISDTGHMEFEIPIDELDIAKVQVGQKASITLDALTETETSPLSGEVSKIAIEGTSSNGVTTYPVTIRIDSSEKLKGGMNANAEIFVSQKENVLLLPLEAVQKIGNRAFVMVKSNGSTSADKNVQPGNWNKPQNTTGSAIGQNANGNRTRPNRNNGSGAYSPNPNGTGNNSSTGNNGSVKNNSSARNNNTQQGNFQGMMGRSSQNQSYYSNAVPKMVEIGINNENYIEIVSGLNEGEEVILPPVTSSSGSSTKANAMGMGGFGGGGQSRFGR